MYIHSPPEKIKIARDVDLIDGGQNVAVVAVLQSERLTPENYRRVVGKAFVATSYEDSACNFGCDICQCECTALNPVYTNPDYSGADICNLCMKRAFNNGLKPVGEYKPGPVYWLSAIVRAATM